MGLSPAEQSDRCDRILAVDDSPDNLFLIESILTEEGYEVTCVEDGQSALRLIESSPPQLVLLDIMMPGMDGYEVTRRIRQSLALPYIPVLLITAHDQPGVVEGLDAGADDFIRKPIVEVDELLARVRSLLRLKHTIDERDHIARQREDFVSRLTHDLRTPLVAADRMLTLLNQGAFGEIPPSVQEATDTMIRSNQNLLQMVNTLLEVYRFEAGRKSLTYSTFNFSEMIAEVITELSPLAREKGLSLQFDDSITQAEAKVVAGISQFKGDRLELRRVVANLVGNAIKFTDTGSVNVRLKLENSVLPSNGNEEKNSSCLIVEIEDTGAGIDAADQSTIFERFRQGRHKRSGSGLGLHLARRILEAHQGAIDVQSELNCGSIFTVKLPILV